ncbi:MAG: carboxylesterase/lipase family protein [Candidatus Eiseniibacteriota bacterium]
MNTVLQTEAVVKTRQGELRGRHADGVFTFLGIPYGAPPTGARRLRPPQPVEPWNGVRDALGYGAAPPQLLPDPETRKFVPDPSEPGEDCLNLNLWSPALGAAGLPVMVWIPGGMFEAGSGASYDGSRFARDGVICVTINYRVGADGFLHLGDGIANCGLLDQVAALEWVRENIAAFGGDPANVTVFGESAGAMSIGTLLSMPRAEGLFRRAICESGAAHLVMSAATALRMSRRLAEKLGVEAKRDALAAVPVERFLAVQAELKAELLAHPDPQRWGLEVVRSLLPWHPVVDGNVVPSLPLARILAGAGAKVDVLIGSNTEDWKLFRVLDGGLDRVNDAILTGPVDIHGYLALETYGLRARTAIAVYRTLHPGASPGEVLAAVQTDWWCRMPAIRLADAHVRSAGPAAATYMYEFAWPSPVFGGRLGACHGLEIPFVFDTLDRGAEQIVGPLLGPSPPQQLARTMHAAWIAFARSANPGWPRYDLERRATMRFDTVSKVVYDPRPAEQELWKGIL